MARGIAKSSARCVNGELRAGFTGFILVENGWGGKCETRGSNQEQSEMRKGFERVRRRWRDVAGGTEKRRPEAGGTKTGLALGEGGGGNDAGAFLDGDDLISGNAEEPVVWASARPADDDPVSLGVITEAEGEDEFA